MFCGEEKACFRAFVFGFVIFAHDAEKRVQLFKTSIKHDAGMQMDGTVIPGNRIGYF